MLWHCWGCSLCFWNSEQQEAVSHCRITSLSPSHNFPDIIYSFCLVRWEVSGTGKLSLALVPQAVFMPVLWILHIFGLQLAQRSLKKQVLLAIMQPKMQLELLPTYTTDGLDRCQSSTALTYQTEKVEILRQRVLGTPWVTALHGWGNQRPSAISDQRIPPRSPNKVHLRVTAVFKPNR